MSGLPHYRTSIEALATVPANLELKQREFIQCDFIGYMMPLGE
jgi:hypothetical protein